MNWELVTKIDILKSFILRVAENVVYWMYTDNWRRSDEKTEKRTVVSKFWIRI